ncbi:MAG: aspartate aminotransferase family protein [Candidatus Thorarchaeota archaeon]|nr:aspartate aminotransferase family protein [Candidatus Thorarchaeota archaeon]
MLEDYKKRTPKSEKLWFRANKVFAGGVNHNIRNFGMPSAGAYPPYIKSGKGSRIWDVDGNEYVDWWMTHYSDILGHSHPPIVNALRTQLEDCIHIGALNEHQVEFAEELQKAIPFLQKMRFCTTGSEATMYVTRLARLFTGRRLVAKARGGWHGGNDAVGYHVRHPFDDDPYYNGLSFDFNDAESVTSLLKQHEGEVAAIIVEPVLGAGGGIPPVDGFLSLLREETEKRDILLIFDEIITGFRLAYGSAGTNIFGVEPDLLTLGKIVAGGMPFGLYGGREDIMGLAAPGAKDGRWVGGGTFSSHPLSMVSGLATLAELRSRSDQYGQLSRSGDRFRQKLNDVFESLGSNNLATGVGSMLFINCLSKRIEGALTGTKVGDAFDHQKQDLFQAHLMEQGIFGYHGLGAMSFVHSQEDLDRTLMSAENAASRILDRQ